MNKLTSLNAFESISKNQMKEIVGGKLAPVAGQSCCSNTDCGTDGVLICYQNFCVHDWTN